MIRDEVADTKCKYPNINTPKDDKCLTNTINKTNNNVQLIPDASDANWPTITSPHGKFREQKIG